MTASELIQKLQETIETYGDCLVQVETILDDDDYHGFCLNPRVFAQEMRTGARYIIVGEN